MDAGNRIDTEESGVEAQIQQVMKSPAKLTGQIDNFRHFYPCWTLPKLIFLSLSPCACVFKTLSNRCGEEL